MHYKDGTPVTLGDIIKSPSGLVGMVIGGTVGSTACNLNAVVFKDIGSLYSSGNGFIAKLVDDKNKLIAVGAVAVEMQSCLTASECEKLGHVDIGHG